MSGAKRIQKPAKPIRETIVYPKIKVDDASNPCLDPWISFEHVLRCGHLVTTALPNEPCAPNCHHMNGAGDLNRSLKDKKTMKMTNGKQVGEQEFYCDACVEMEFEKKIPVTFSSSQAEELRTTLRSSEARSRKKRTDFKHCYIGLKVTRVQCRGDGTLSSRYVPAEKRHPFDTAVPRSGENMFEDIDLKPKEELKKAATTIETRTLQAVAENDPDIENNDSGIPVQSNRASRRNNRQIVQRLRNNIGLDDDRATGAVGKENNHQTTGRGLRSTQARSKEHRLRRNSSPHLHEQNELDSIEGIKVATRSPKRKRDAPVTRTTTKKLTKKRK